MWPVNIAKPLMSPLLLENSNRSINWASSTVVSVTPVPSQTAQGSIEPPTTFISTPRHKSDLRLTLANPAIDLPDTSTTRILFRKVEKAMDQQAFELARLQQENRALRAQLEAVKKTKRKKVVVDPNTVFASIEQIHRAQVEVCRIEEDVEEESGSEIAVSEASCIVVGSKRR